MSDGKVVAETLLSSVMPRAKELLSENGEFFPFAHAMAPDETIVAIAGYDERERPPSSEIIDLIVYGLQSGGTKGDYVATALVYDVLVVPPGQTVKSDAVAIELEHREGYAVTVIFPYRIEGGVLDVSAPFATAARRGIFGSR